MSREWNGKLLDNDRSGDALATVIIEWVAVPSAVLTTVGLLWWVYSGGAEWFYYVGAIIAGPIMGLFLATAIGFACVIAIVVLALVLFPFEIGYRRIKRTVGDREADE